MKKLMWIVLLIIWIIAGFMILNVFGQAQTPYEQSLIDQQKRVDEIIRQIGV